MVVAMTDCKGCKHETECNHNERYDYKYDAIVDYQTDKEYNSFKDISKLLNEKEERIKSKERVIKAYEDYIKTLKEDGVLDE